MVKHLLFTKTKVLIDYAILFKSNLQKLNT